MNLENLQYDLLKTELSLTQVQMDKYDDLSLRIKTWAVTLWIASIGWSLQTKNSTILKWSIFALVLFWIFDAMNKVYRQDYKKRRGEVAHMLSSLIQNKEVEGKIMDLPEHSMTKLSTQLFAPHLGLLYWVLIVVSWMLSR